MPRNAEEAAQFARAEAALQDKLAIYNDAALVFAVAALVVLALALLSVVRKRWRMAAILTALSVGLLVLARWMSVLGIHPVY